MEGISKSAGGRSVEKSLLCPTRTVNQSGGGGHKGPTVNGMVVKALCGGTIGPEKPPKRGN